jgi:putative membrane protein
MPTMRRPALIALLLAAACHRAVAPIDTAPVAQQMSEANVVAIILAANNTDLSYARLATSRSTNMAVRTYAQRMTLDHTILNNRATEIAQRNGITPEDNERSTEFRDNSASRRDALRDLEGARFDSAYAANEVAFHNEFLGLLDKTLVPNAHTLELREFVRNLRPAMSAHLGHAEEMRASVAKRK